MSIQTRADQLEQDTWDLSSLFKESADWEAATEAMKQRIAEGLPSERKRVIPGYHEVV